ncbi:hypothetical protein Mgra_00005240 [Meloidogyne graminicola]|uniref:Uncharacterized protein n=1 Tax=Meloidogyne graminicola TaxID=189291 RepID=A0A8S9ZQ86_9BILA|nr:hypothetical protein Mgra_00005240 [Meloidogyne graminicola]
MFRILFIYLFLFIFTIAEIVENNLVNCPNNGEPKKMKKVEKLFNVCLVCHPKPLCGPNYLCFFSGFNYQCPI